MAETRRSGSRRTTTSKRAGSKPSAKKQAKGAGAAKKQAKARSAQSSPARAGASGRNPGRSQAGRSASNGKSRRAQASRASAAGKNGAPSAGQSRRKGGLSAIEAVERAREHLSQLLGRPVDGVLGVDRDRGNWIVTAQVLELARIPNTTDVLGEYEAILDKNGEVLGYRRTRRYHRGQVDGTQ